MFQHYSFLIDWLRRQRRLLGYAALSTPLFATIPIAAYWLRYEGHVPAETVADIHLMIPWVISIKIAAFGWFRVYQGWNRYLTFYDLVTLAQATVASSLVLVLAAYLLIPEVVIPRSVFLMDCLGTIVVFGGLRSAVRYIDELRPSLISSRGRTRAFIVGANDSGEALLRTIRRKRSLPYQIVGFLAGPGKSLPSQIGGIGVLGGVDQLDHLSRKHRVQEVLITADDFTGKQVKTIVQQGRSVGVQVKVLPSLEQLLGRRVDLKPRTVSIQDLLRRDPVKLDMRGLHQWIDDKVLLVTGAAGSIGSEICRQLLQFEPQRMVMLDRNENGLFYLERELRKRASSAELEFKIADANDYQCMKRLFQTQRPDIVFHAAAYKHVPLMEANACEAVKNIVLATRQLADLSEEFDVGSFVMISTDKAVNPTSVMGACKRVAETYVQALTESSTCQYVTVRFGNVLDSAGSVVPIFREQIAQGGPVTVTHPDMQRYFMMIPEASQLVIQAGAMGQGGEVFVLDMGDPVRIYDLACEMINLSGLELGRDIEVQFTGVRPGEKLFEELHVRGESHVPTIHPKIMIAASTRVSHESIDQGVDRLALLARQGSASIIDELRHVVPDYGTGRPTPSSPMERAA